MASDLGVGDAETASLVVAPADTDTAATLTATAPDGTTTSVPVSGGALEPITGSDDSQQTWTSDDPVVYSAAGRWVLTWTVTGTGEGVEALEVYVVASPTAGGPTWTPGRSKVAAYVPHRTLARSVTSTTESQDTYQYTFDQSTTPTGVQTDALIADAVAWVSARVVPMQAGLYDLARAVAALLAAAWVERSWPDDDQSLTRANDMEKRADAMLADLVAANAAGSDTGEYGVDLVNPVHSFPLADPRWDYSGYW